MENGIDLSDYLANQSLDETIDVLDEVMSILVIHTEYAGLSENLSHQYLTIRGLRDLFVRLGKDN